MLVTNVRSTEAAPSFGKGGDAGPIIKWVGGKTRILTQLLPLLPSNIEMLRHVEPFVGGAALFFHIAPARAVLADINQQLMATYRCVQTDVEPLIERLHELEALHNEFRYYQMRHRYNHGTKLSAVERSALFIYLNKTCFNGLHRVNRRGEFNVPVGSYRTPRVVDSLQLWAAHWALQGVELRTGDFSHVLEDAGRGDFIFLDSPYDVEPGARNFTAYTSSPFGPEQQDQQAELFRVLDRRGCKLMLSNSDTRANRKRYARYEISEVLAPRSISRNGARRAAVKELVVRNYV